MEDADDTVVTVAPARHPDPFPCVVLVQLAVRHFLEATAFLLASTSAANA